MEPKDIIYDVIDDVLDGSNELTVDIDTLVEKILDELNICDKCGAKLKGDRNE